MDKSRQKQLALWLKAQRFHAKRWLNISVVLGTCSAITILLQAYCLAELLQRALIDHQPLAHLYHWLILLLGCFALRAILHYYREKAGTKAGETLRQAIRETVLNRLEALGPVWVASRPVGSWTTLLHEQIEKMHDYYARYLPQITLAGVIPLLILITLYPINWAAATILFLTAPLIPLFMAMVGMGAADANRRNFAALARLSGDFLDRLRGLDTLRLFNRRQAEEDAIAESSEQFRLRTMEVLRIAFLSSAVLEFFASVSIAIVAVYFGFSYLGVFHFGSYSTTVTLFAGFIALILAPEFFQPLRDLGSFYHAKAQASGAADEIEAFLARTETLLRPTVETNTLLTTTEGLTLEANDLIITSADGVRLVGPINFQFQANQRIALVGPSGSGKSTLINVLLGFLAYQGSLQINGQELSTLSREAWLAWISWVGQHPRLFSCSIAKNISPDGTLSAEELNTLVAKTGVDEFLDRLPHGLDTEVSEDSHNLSVGQAQRIAVARALAKQANLLLLDEPTASLDRHHEQHIMASLQQASHQQMTLMVTHQLDQLIDWPTIIVMEAGNIVQVGDYATLAAKEGLFQRMLSHRSGEIE
ncbi:cysteine/glutathione ABC transporter permease/ATP-binding protein CydD [Rosenbergiella australiborealis]|uniref:ABC-type xenobiotic transporter n=2 Tax=Rosenbergiella TaxID=1356488 RepID=A0ABS5T3P5_9GAMM|nr:cysteine/glutathione ABC transporter permease/ATP-binding protein CydD [Rosenbergiella australiborealis]